MADPFLGEIRMVGFNFNPVGWALCDGSLLQINSNTALFALLGTQFGGDGIKTFGLPDLRQRVAVDQGAGPGGPPAYPMGYKGGAANTAVNLTAANLPAHNHSVAPPVSGGSATTNNPQGAYPALLATNVTITTPHGGVATAATAGYSQGGTPNTTGYAYNTGNAGSSQPVQVPTMPPFLVVNFIIALQGIFPSRN